MCIRRLLYCFLTIFKDIRTSPLMIGGLKGCHYIIYYKYRGTATPEVPGQAPGTYEKDADGRRIFLSKIIYPGKGYAFFTWSPINVRNASYASAEGSSSPAFLNPFLSNMTTDAPISIQKVFLVSYQPEIWLYGCLES